MDTAIERLDGAGLEARLTALGGLLHACVSAGASVGFVLPLTVDEACAFWRTKVLPGVQGGGRSLWVALVAGEVVGTVQLVHDTPANQPHRAEIAKLLVHPAWRRRGIARALMAVAEAEARRRGRSLITLDTRTGDAAEPLYTDLGYATAGIIPGYCLDALDPTRLDPTTVMYKAL